MSDSQYGGARRGLHGKLISAETHAPEWATQGDIQDVAFVAWQTDRDVGDVWGEIEHGD